MKHLALFILVTAIGAIFGFLTGFNPLEHGFFSTFSSIALAIGLYVGVAGIDLKALGRYRNTAIFIVTAGVPLQIFLTAGIMWLIYPHPISILVAVAIDQIDPLSVSTLLTNKVGMSKEAKALLRVWASFDDPMTVLVGFAFLIPLVTGVAMTSATTYLASLFLNFVPSLILYFLYKKDLLKNTLVQSIILICVLGFTIYYQTFMLAAIIGLFIRPFGEKKMSHYVAFLYNIVIFTVGTALIHEGLDLRLGILLALVEFFIVQPISALVMVKGTTNDIFRLAFAQQNGLTTILMGLGFQALGFNVLPILLPAMVVINFLNLSINAYYSWKIDNGQLVAKADAAQLKKHHDTLAIN